MFNRIKTKLDLPKIRKEKAIEALQDNLLLSEEQAKELIKNYDEDAIDLLNHYLPTFKDYMLRMIDDVRDMGNYIKNLSIEEDYYVRDYEADPTVYTVHEYIMNEFLRSLPASIGGYGEKGVIYYDFDFYHEAGDFQYFYNTVLSKNKNFDNHLNVTSKALFELKKHFGTSPKNSFDVLSTLTETDAIALIPDLIQAVKKTVVDLIEKDPKMRPSEIYDKTVKAIDGITKFDVIDTAVLNQIISVGFIKQMQKANIAFKAVLLTQADNERKNLLVNLTSDHLTIIPEQMELLKPFAIDLATVGLEEAISNIMTPKGIAAPEPTTSNLSSYMPSSSTLQYLTILAFVGTVATVAGKSLYGASGAWLDRLKKVGQSLTQEQTTAYQAVAQEEKVAKTKVKSSSHISPSSPIAGRKGKDQINQGGERRGHSPSRHKK